MNRKWLMAIVAVISLLVLYFGYDFVQDNKESSTPINDIAVTEDGGFQVPAIQLPDSSENADMIGLIVYQGRIYTQTATEISSEHARKLVGEKLGTTKANIDEWSKQDQYDIEFASTIGETEVYSVIGYDKDFRIMSYMEHGGEIYTEFYECLNGIVVHDGEDVFGKLNMTGQVVNTQYQIYNDWYNTTGQFKPIEDLDLVNRFVEELNHTVPYPRRSVEEEIGDFRNNDQYRSMIIQLRDGSEVRIVVIKDGYVFYGNTSLYFKMEPMVFAEMWAAMEEEEAVSHVRYSSLPM